MYCIVLEWTQTLKYDLLNSQENQRAFFEQACTDRVAVGDERKRTRSSSFGLAKKCN